MAETWTPDRPLISYGLTVGENIARLRDARGLASGTLAARCGLSRAYLWKLERGEVENPGVATLDRIARALGARLTDLTEWRVPPASSQEGWPDNSMLEAAWGIIANAYGARWEDASDEWRGAAERWRDAYHRVLDRAAPPAPGALASGETA